MAERERAQTGTQSVKRALDILRIIATGRESGVLFGDILSSTGLTRPTCHRIVSLLVEEGLVERKPRTKRFAIGAQIPYLALARPMNSPWIGATTHFLDEAAQTVGDTAFVTVRSSMDTLCIARRIGHFPVQVLSLEVGGRRPLGVSSGGMAILAALPERVVGEIVGYNARRYADFSVTPEAVTREVTDARRRGYALRTSGLVPGTSAVSVPVEGRDGSIGALTVAGLRRRLNPRRLETLVEFLLGAKRSVEAQLHRSASPHRSGQS